MEPKEDNRTVEVQGDGSVAGRFIFSMLNI